MDARNILFSYSRRPDLGLIQPPSYLYKGHRGTFPELKRRGLALTTPLAPRLRICRVIHLPPSVLPQLTERPLSLYLVDSASFSNSFYFFTNLIHLVSFTILAYLSLHVSDQSVHHQEDQMLNYTSSFWRRCLGR